MLELFSFDDNKKIGMVLLLISAFLYFFGIIFLFARSLLLLSNLFFFSGLYFFIGFTGLVKFFVKKGKIKGSLIYFGGLILIIINLGFFGAVAQIFGILLIFRTFLPDLYDYVCRVPVVGKKLLAAEYPIKIGRNEQQNMIYMSLVNQTRILQQCYNRKEQQSKN